MKHFALLIYALASNLTAGQLPDCSDRAFDQDRRIIIIEDITSPSLLAALQVLSTMEHERYLFDSLFPIIKSNRATIHTRFSRYYEREARQRIDQALTTLAGLDGVEIRCTLYQPGET